MKNPIKPSFLSVVLSAALLASAPVVVSAQTAAPAAAARQNTASQVVLASSTRILTTLDQRRAEFKSNPAALRQFVTSEFNTLFDGDYAARLVLGVHGRGASDADVKLFGQALTEQTVYDKDSGQLLSGSLMDYAMPRADIVPPVTFDMHNSVCTTNPLGVKGAGEAGAIGAPPAVINALVDAMAAHTGIKHIDMPATPLAIWQMIQAHRKKAAA